MSVGSSAMITRTLALILLVLCSSACSGALTPQIPAKITPRLQITPTSGERTVVVDKAPLRTEPVIESQQLAMLDRGQIVSLLGTSPDGAWYLVRTDVYTGTGWIFAELVDMPIARASLKGSDLSLRAGPGNSYDSIGLLQKASVVQLIGAANECTWLKVIAPDGAIGWIPGNDVTLNVRCDSIQSRVQHQLVPKPLVLRL